MKKTLASAPTTTQQLWETTISRIKGAHAFSMLWHDVLSDADRRRADGDMEAAFRRFGTASELWKKLRGITAKQAVIEVAYKLGHLDAQARERLERSVGESQQDVEAVIDAAVATGGLVILDAPRQIFWQGKPVDLDWARMPALWDYLVRLAQHSKAGTAIDYTAFGESTSPKRLSQHKNRLKKLSGFPSDLAELIKPGGRGEQRLAIPPEAIHIFETESHETLKAWKP